MLWAVPYFPALCRGDDVTTACTAPGNNPEKHCLISGASGALGSALARRCADSGTLLSLWGRDRERLEKVRGDCASRNALADIIACDIRDHERCRALLRETFASRPVDMAILNAGVSSGIPPGGMLESAEDACRTIETDCAATINMAATLLECMQARGTGHIVFISSIAGLYPLPCSPAYSAAKAALAYYAKSLRLGLHGSPIRISIVYPGYIASPMSDRLVGPQPFRITADEAAERILDGLSAGKNCIAFPLLLALGARILHFMPMPLASFFLKGFRFTVTPDDASSQNQQAANEGEGR